MKIRGFAAAGQATTPVPTAFLADEVPNAPSDYIKVYLYGLYLAGLASPPAACEMEQKLHMTSSEIEDAFTYWQNRDVVSIRSDGTVCFTKTETERPVEPYPYVAFNMRIAEALGRDPSAYELKEIYSWLETYDFPQEVAVALIAHCVERKGPKVHISYMNKVASVWAENGVENVENAQQQIETYHACAGGARQIMVRMGVVNRHAGATELDMYRKWTTEYGFTHEGIVRAMSGIEFSSIEKPFSYLDAILIKLHEKGLHTAQEIAERGKQDSDEIQRVKEAMRMLGERSAVTQTSIDTYRNWAGIGYDHSIILLACARGSRYAEDRLKRVGGILTAWKKKGLSNEAQVRSVLAEETSIEYTMQEIYESAGIERKVCDADTRMYKHYANDCSMSPDVIRYAAELSSVAQYPVRYMESILERWAKGQVKSIEEARSECEQYQIEKERQGLTHQAPDVQYAQRKYMTSAELEERTKRSIQILKERYGNT